MLLIACPHCGTRNSSEFRHTGEAKSRPDPSTVGPQTWREYLYTRANAAGWVREGWYHAMGCRRFFALERHTVTHEVRPATGASS